MAIQVGGSPFPSNTHLTHKRKSCWKDSLGDIEVKANLFPLDLEVTLNRVQNLILVLCSP